MLTGKQKRFLRSKAHHLNPIFQIGKNGVTPEVLHQITEALEARELIKVNVLQNCEQTKEEIEAIFEQQPFEIVQKIGHIFVLYAESVDHKKLHLPE